ncbi:hypothetical protein QBC43DRAFT_326471 [Cladorrhinum sp. PSN259]|nr:hypothetical protein QBC43DRAFT_326471 [Cladorrhinum sp. PSN259]
MVGNMHPTPDDRTPLSSQPPFDWDQAAAHPPNRLFTKTGTFFSSKTIGSAPPDPNRSRFRTWGLEVGGLLLSTAAFVALVVLLRYVDGKQLNDWNFYFSINTVVSTIAIVMRTPLAFVVGSCIGHSKWSWFKKRPGPLSGFVLFDDASRGPLGSLGLLWWLKLKHWSAIGAFVTVALVAVDPIFQALVVYESRPVPILQHNNATMPLVSRASQLDVGQQVEMGNIRIVIPEVGFKMGTLLTVQPFPDVGMSSTMVTALVNSSLSSQTQPPSLSCGTGNCTYPAYSSLGICSKCFDISSRLVKTSKVGTPSDNPMSFFSGSAGGAGPVMQSPYTNYMIPYRAERPLLAQNLDGPRDFGFNNKTGRQAWARIALSAVFQPNETYNFRDSDRLLASFAIIAPPRDYWDNLTEWQDARMQAAECALEFCARVQETKVENGNVAESTLVDPSGFEREPDSFIPIDDNGARRAGDDLRAVNKYFGKSLNMFNYTAWRDPAEMRQFSYLIAYVVKRTDLQLRLKEEVARSLNASDSIQTTFNITQASITTMINHLAKSYTLESMTLALMDSHNITTTFEQAAERLTFRMREISGATVAGKESHTVTFIRVQWVFGIFPVVVFAFGLIYSLRSAWESHSLGLGALKTDLLAALLHGLDSETRNMMRERKSMGLSPEKISVRLKDGHGGSYLRAEEPSR